MFDPQMYFTGNFSSPRPTITTHLFLCFSFVFLFPSRVPIHFVMSVLEMFVKLTFLHQENIHEDKGLCIRFPPQDNQPIIPVSMGCATSFSRLCSTLTNSSKLRFPSRFASNKWKTISTTMFERDMPYT